MDEQEALKKELSRLRRLRKKYYANPEKNRRLIFALETRIELINQKIVYNPTIRRKQRIEEFTL